MLEQGDTGNGGIGREQLAEVILPAVADEPAPVAADIARLVAR